MGRRKIKHKTKNAWIEIYPEEINTKKKWPSYIVLKPKYSTIYFSVRLIGEYFGDSKRVKIRYHQEANLLAFLSTSDPEHSYKISGNNTIKAKNVFNRLKVSLTENKSYFVRYNPETQWLEVNLEEEIKKRR